MKQIKVIIIAVALTDEGATEYVVGEGTIDHSLDAMQRMVGGLIEFCPTDDTFDIVVNEEFMFNNSVRNELAEQVWKLVDKYGCIDAGHQLRGDVMLIGSTDGQGNSTDVPDDLFDKVQALCTVSS